MEKPTRLKSKTTGQVYTLVGGTILDQATAKKKDITGSFLTLLAEDGTHELYLWSYGSDNVYELVLESEAV